MISFPQIFRFVLLLFPLSVFAGNGYFQLSPFNNFIDPAPAHNYLKHQPPASPWKTEPEQPSVEDLAKYKKKIAAIAEYSAAPGAPSGAVPGAFPETLAQTLAAQIIKSMASTNPLSLMGVDGKMYPSATRESIVSPWIIISPLPVGPVYEQSPANSNQSGSESAPPAVSGVLRRPVNGGTSDIYIPFSYAPGTQPPPATSGVIYSQPDERDLKRE